LPFPYLLVAVVASVNLWRPISRRPRLAGSPTRNRIRARSVFLGMTLYRLLPVLLVALSVLVLVSACGGKGGSGY